MEAVAFVAREPHSDHPRCASESIGAFLRDWNDSLDDERRQWLKPYVLRLVGTAAPAEVEKRRAYLAIDWYVRTFAPTWLELANLYNEAAALRSLAQIVDIATTGDAQGPLSAAESAAESAAWSAAWSAAESAARSAAESAAWSAAESAAESAAWSAAESAARSAAESAAWSAAESAARSAAESAAESAAWSAAESAARSAAESAAESAAWSAAEQALAGTVERLQRSALDLLDRMIAEGATGTGAGVGG
jgi:hypothetical protein